MEGRERLSGVSGINTPRAPAHLGMRNVVVALAREVVVGQDHGGFGQRQRLADHRRPASLLLLGRQRTFLLVPDVTNDSLKSNRTVLL